MAGYTTTAKKKRPTRTTTTAPLVGGTGGGTRRRSTIQDFLSSASSTTLLLLLLLCALQPQLFSCQQPGGELAFSVAAAEAAVRDIVPVSSKGDDGVMSPAFDGDHRRLGERYDRDRRGDKWLRRGSPMMSTGDSGAKHPVKFLTAQERRPGFMPAENFPTVENSTVLFLHVFKCAGTSLREILINWAATEGYSGAVVHECPIGRSTVDTICLNEDNDLYDVGTQRYQVTSNKVLAGHFFWDFRKYVEGPYLMITMLRNPLELFVSAQQFKHRDETGTLKEAVAFVSGVMKQRLRWDETLNVGFIRRFVDQDIAVPHRMGPSRSRHQYTKMAINAAEHVKQFWVVGVVEQYAGFLEVLRRSLDPHDRRPEVWAQAHNVKNNGSPVHSADVLRSIDPELVAQFNATSVGLQWEVYDIALHLWDRRCREVLPLDQHHDLCTVRM